jgi:RsiW-degrading membrane proteinase PrsW (M82 family)
MTQAYPPSYPPGPRPGQRPAGQVSDLFPVGDWIRHHHLRSFPVLLFLLLICVPSVALVILGNNPGAGAFTAVAWIFAAYFAVAWLLLLGVILRPEHVTRPMLGVLVAVALVTQVPLAIALETALHSSETTLGLSIVTVGIPEELAKAVPVLAVALVYRRRHGLLPRDYLFLGAVSGLAFGASEVVHYYTVNGVAEFYQTVQAAVPPIKHLISTGHSTSVSVFAVLIGPVLYFIIDFVWRFVTDPISHACWAGLTGYFIGLAVSTRYRWYQVGWIGLAMAAVLHGLNDWGEVNGHPVWILVIIASGVLFLGYAKVGARTDHQFTEALPPVFRTHQPPDGQPPGPAAGPEAETPAGRGLPVQAGRRPGSAVPGSPVPGSAARPWWEH